MSTSLSHRRSARAAARLLFSALLLASVSVAWANTVTYNFGGTFGEQSNDALPGIPLGTPFTGTLTYQYPQTGTIVGSWGEYTLDSLSVTVASQTVSTTAADIYVDGRDTGYPTDALIAGEQEVLSGSPTLAGYLLQGFYLELQTLDPQPPVILNRGLPGGGLTLSDFTQGNGTFVEWDFSQNLPNNSTWVRGELTYLNSVPEPATLSLLGSALLGLGLVYLRRRVKA